MNIKSKIYQKSQLINKYIFQIIIVLLVFVIYGNTMMNKYSLDDDLVVENHPLVEKGINGIPEIFTSHYVTNSNTNFGYRPLVVASFALEYELFGKSPMINHLINIILYIFSGLLIFMLLRTFFNNYSAFFSFLISMLFLAHPLHTEVVASLKNRDEILSLIFAMLAMWSFFKYSDYNNYWHLLSGSLFFGLSLLSKLSTIPFIAIFPLAVYFFRDVSLKKILVILIVGLIVYFAIRFLTKNILHNSSRGSDFFENPLYSDKTFQKRIIALLISLFYYIKLIIIPFPMRFYYGYNTVDITSWNHSGIYVSIIFITISIYLIVKYFRKKNPLIFGLLFFLISISMFLNFVKPNAGIIAERFLYSASLGFSIILTILLFMIFKIDFRSGIISKRNKIRVLIPYTAILIIFSLLVVSRNRIWHDRMSLFSHDIKYLKNSAKANGLYATKILFNLTNNPEAKVNDHELIKAINHFSRSVEIFPGYYSSWNNMGYIYLIFYGSPDKALEYFNKALEIKPDFPEAHFYKGLCFESKGDFEKAVESYKNAYKYKPEYIEAISKLANWNYKNGKYRKSITLNKKIFEIDQHSDIPYINTGNYFYFRKDLKNALKYWEKGYYVNPSNTINLKNLISLSKQLNLTEKEKHYSIKLKGL